MDAYTMTFIFEFGFFLLLWILSFSPASKKLFRSKLYFHIGLLIIVFFQILSAFLLKKEVGDVMLFSGAGKYLRQKIDFYWIDSSHGQYPFFPFMIFLYAGLNHLWELFPLATFSFYLKLVLLIPLHWVGLIIQKQNSHLSQFEARQLRWQFLVNPITYSIVLFHGQTDIVLIWFLILSLLVLTKLSKNTLQSVLLSSALFAASVATKTWSILVLPIISKHIKNIWLIALFWSTTLILLLGNIYFYIKFVWNSSLETVTQGLLSAGGPVGIWGVSLILTPWLDIVIANKLVLFVALLGLLSWLLLIRSIPIWETLFLFILGLYIIQIHWAVQYLIWIIPWLYLPNVNINATRKNTFIIIAATYSFIDYVNIAHSQVIIPTILLRAVGCLLWIMCLIWFWQIYHRYNVHSWREIRSHF